MYGVVREFQAPLGVTHATRGRFGATPSSLATVFARKNSLDIYVVRANLEMARLELLHSTPLGANVISMATLRRNSDTDLLVLAFDRMRVTILSWHHDSRTWVTDQLLDLASLLGSKLCSPTSVMRSHDPADFGRALLRGMEGGHSEPVVRADPRGRCLAVLAKNQSVIYIVPIQAEDDSAFPASRIVNTADVFIIDLPNEYEASNVKDFAFLHGSFEPNITILHEPKRTWSGRAAIQRNTCFLLNISVDIRSKRSSKTWTMDQLPYDCEKLEAVPESAGGGALLLSASVIMQVRHGACVAGLSLNCFGDDYSTEVKTKYDTIIASDMLVECDAAHCRFLDVEEVVTDSSTSGMQSISLLSLKGGELYFLSVAVGSRTTITMKRAGSTVIASEIVPVNERFFVLASRLSDSLLVEYQKSADDSESEKSGEGASKKSNGASDSRKGKKRKKRRRTAEEEAEYMNIYGTNPPQESSDEDSDDENAGKPSALELQEKDEGTRGVYDDDDELGWVFNSGSDESDRGSKSGSGKWALKVKDTLPCFGPGGDLAVGISPDDITQTKLDMVVAGGYGKNGCLAVVHQSIRPIIRTEFEVQGCNGVWALLDPRISKKERIDREKRSTADRNRFIEEAIFELRKEKAEKKRILSLAKKENEDVETTDNKPVVEDEKSTQPNEAAGLSGIRSSDNVDKTEAILNEAKNDDGIENMSQKIIPSPDVTDIKVEDELVSPLKRKKKNDGSSVNLIHDNEDSIDDVDVITSEEMKTLQLQAEASFPLEAEGNMGEGGVSDNSLHSYMLLSTATSTTILRTGSDIVEVVDGSVDFVTTEKTVAAGNIFGSYSMVQVVPSAVRVLTKGTIECEFSMSERGSLIRRAQVSDPLVLLETEDDQVIILSIEAEPCLESSIMIKEPSDVLEEEMFDDYGMAVAGVDTHLHQKENILPTAVDADGKTGDPSIMSGYKDFSITVEFSHITHPALSSSITTAYLYKGPLAAEISKDGILSSSKDVSDLAAVSENPHPDEKVAPIGITETLNEKEENALSNIPEVDDTEQIDDEDRMLYGDDNAEDDMMLYGTGESNVDEGKQVSSEKEELAKKEGAALGNVDANTSQDLNQGGSKRKPGKTTHVEKGVLSLPGLAGIQNIKEQLLVLINKDGSLLVLSCSLHYAVVLENPLFFAAPPLVRDFNTLVEEKGNNRCAPASNDLLTIKIVMMEVSGSALLPGLSTPILVALSRTGIPLIYRAFMASKPTLAGKPRSRLTMKRITFRDRTAHLFSRCMKLASAAQQDPTKVESIVSKQTVITRFQNIAGRGGLFVGGLCPFFLFAERGYPRIHPLTRTNTLQNTTSREDYEMGQGVAAFTEFHNIKCPRGFVSVSDDGIVKIGELPPPSILNYDAPTPMRKIALRCTPHKVAYHAGSATYGVLASMPTLTRREERLARILQSLEKHDKRHYQYTAAQAEAETGDEKANRVPPLFEELHELRVYRPDTWELIKSHKLQKGEVGLAIANMTVDVYKQKKAGVGVDIPSSKKGDDGNESAFAASLKMRPKNMLVVGTGHLNGEDASSRGRLLLFEISRQDAYTDAGGYTAFQLQLIAEKELFSPVTAVAAMEGYVIAGVGPQVSVYKLVGDEVVHLSFAFGQLYCSSLASIKQYVVAADMCKSVSFMYFRDRNNSVNFLGKDYEHVTSYATEFLIENENMSIVVSDGRGNFHLMNYAHAAVPESRGGKRLLVNGGLNFGSRINRFVRTKAPDTQLVQAGMAGQQTLLFTTLDGGIGGLIAVPGTTFKQLEKVRSQLVNHDGVLRHSGVNPEEQTAFRPESASTVVLEQRLLDSRAAFDIFGVSLVEMRMISRDAKVNIKDVVDTLLSVDSVLFRF